MTNLRYPIEAFIQAAQLQNQNRLQAMQDAVGIGENLGQGITGVTEAVQALKKKRAMNQLVYAMQQPQELPVQGPSLPGMDQMPSTVQPSAGQPGSMAPNPAANVMDPLSRVYPEIIQKSIAAQLDPLMQSQIFKNYATGTKDRTPRDIFEVSQDGTVVPKKGQSLTHQEAQVYIRQKAINEAKNKSFGQINLGLRRLQTAKTAQDRQAAQFVIQQAQNALMKALQPEIYGEISEMAPDAMNILGGFLNSDTASMPKQTTEGVDQWFKKNYPGIKLTPANRRWAEEKMHGKR